MTDDPSVSSRHARIMEADGYWREVVTSWYFTDETPVIAGEVRALMPMRNGDPPALKIFTRDGDTYLVPAYQARLQALLKQHKPAVGDRIRITYTGEAPAAAPGKKRAKEFTVEVLRQGQGGT